MGKKQRSQRENISNQSFFWQGLLIILPLAVLAIAGIWSLRGQRQAVEQKARLEATRTAESWAHTLSEEIRANLLRVHRPIPLKPGDEPFPFLFPLNPVPADNLEPDRHTPPVTDT